MLAEDGTHFALTRLREIRALVDAELESLIDTELRGRDLCGPIRYTLMQAGKRLRPLLTLALAEDFFIQIDSMLRPALALELLHAASLMHDDLPALDDDDYRRGEPACHRKFTEAQAILAGDYLTSLAFKVLSESRLHESILLKVIAEVSRSYCDVCEGQARDLTPRGRELQTIHHLKTASLFRAAAMLALFPLQNTELLFRAKSFGEALGVYFQCYNDLLDTVGDADEMGRPTRSDMRAEKENVFSDREKGRRLLEYQKQEVEKALSALQRYDSLPNAPQLEITRELLTGLNSRVTLLLKRRN